MKKLTLLFSFVLIWGAPQFVWACDACGLFSGVTPMDLKSQAGLYFRYRTFHGLNTNYYSGPGNGSNKTLHAPSEHPGPKPDGYSPDIRESYYRVAANLRWFLKDRWNLQASLPVTSNFEQYGASRKSGKGYGDISAMLNYGLLIGENDQQAWRVFVGAGLKLPSGWRFRRQKDRENFTDIQGGTGSLDFLLQVQGSWRIGNNGLTANVMTRINTRNSEQVRYGNFHNVNLNIFHQFDLLALNSRLLVYTGGYLEHFSGRFDQGERQTNTGGTTLFSNIGLNWFVDRYSFRPQVQLPVLQKLNGVQLLNQPIVSFEASIAF